MTSILKPIGYLWTGRATIHGVPTRDLDLFEYETYRQQIEESEKASGLTLYSPIFFEAVTEEKEQ